ncbi:unnamed protein product [Amoebophrya sp. A120]|nr:unnamed protein product [Amoebophrya sp. A120]|eukprot:GSA120T00000970001.1
MILNHDRASTFCSGAAFFGFLGGDGGRRRRDVTFVKTRSIVVREPAALDILWGGLAEQDRESRFRYLFAYRGFTALALVVRLAKATHKTKQIPQLGQRMG